MMQSTFISYGTPDEEFARALRDSLQRNSVTTFFFKDDAPPGEKLFRVMTDGVNNHDRVILVCSEHSLNRPGVLHEVEETLAREARDGGASYLIPITLDDYVFRGWRPRRSALAVSVRERVIADFRGAFGDPRKMQAAVLKLVDVLRKR